jgi:methionine-rich copper-binding protein CopC
VVWAPDTPQSVVDEANSNEEETGFAAAADINEVDDERWTQTATNGGGLGQGHPSTITWSIMPDGTRLTGSVGKASGPSDLRARLNSIYGSMNNWLPLFQQVFDRWEAVSGINFVYEPADDGASYSSSNSGVLGVRGDIRIGGHPIDGNSGTLANTSFPNGGDMVLDTGDSYFSDTSNNSIRLRNTVAHEVGHALGLEHSSPTNRTKLMEPVITTSFDGPQHDDILRIQRGYGDTLEGNDTAATATNIGSLSATPTVTTNVSIDDDADVDYFRFTLGASSLVNLTLAPLGFVYTVGLEGDSNELFDSRAQSDLTLAVLNSNATTVLATAALTGLGGVETIAGLSLAAGQYLVRVTGAQNAAQMYTLTAVAPGGGGSNQPPVLSAINDVTINFAAQNGVVTLSATDPNGDPLTYSASAQSIEYHLDQTLGLSFAGSNEFFNFLGRSEKWLASATSTWYYITPDGKFYRWLGGNGVGDPVVEQLSTADYANTALLYNAAINNAPAVLGVSGNTLTINPTDTYAGRLVVTATVNDGRGGTDSETFFVTVLSAGGDSTAPTITNRTPANGATVTSSTANIDVTFSEAVSGVDATDLVLTGTGAATAVKSTPTNIGGNTWRFAVSNLQNGTVNVSLAPDANDIEDAAGNDLAPSTWSFTVNIATNQPPVLSAINDVTINFAAQNGVVMLSASDPNGDPLTYSASAQSIEYHLDQTLGLSFAGGDEFFDFLNRSEKWLASATSTWYYITPDGKFYRWLGGNGVGDPVVEQLSTADYANTALLYNAAINNAPAVLGVSGTTLTINPTDTYAGRLVVTAMVNDGRGGADSETFFVTVLSAGGDPTAPTITNRTPANGATVTSSSTNIDVTFSEAVSGVDATDLVLTGTGAAAAVKSTPTDIGGNTWRFTVSNLQNGTVNVSLAPDANDIEDAAGNDLAPSTWSFTVSIAAVNQPPVLSAINDVTINSATQNGVVMLSATDPNGDPLTYSASAQSIEYHLDQTLGLDTPGGSEYLNYLGRNEKWLTSADSTWYYITPDGKLYRWLGGNGAGDPVVEQLSTADYANTALLYNAAINNAPAVLGVSGSTLTINPTDTYAGRLVVTAMVSDGRGGTDSKTFFVTVG